MSHKAKIIPPEEIKNPDLPRGKIIYYCKDCKEIVEGVQVGQTYTFKCPKCNLRGIAWGTEQSIKNVYKL
ncbi:hypothetical protein COT40_01955 [Candidatus Peregrinibacteria bacterium CG08_land_8_20_14_0_20_41_10]|nr:MAG: hypothetical protein COT40_01955 [Candidatus Peregrinibacteria bacterium CG08_land_8_20_14_0_20_41_10]